MTADYRDISNKTITDANAINYRLIEKALAMRCISYLAQIKSHLLTDTIFEIDHSKKALSSINAKLKQEIHERKLAEKKLEKAKNEAEEANRLKDKFVALVSHDLNNPLNIVIGYLELLQSSQELSDSGNKMIDNALTASHDMASFIHDILNMSRIKGGKIIPECTVIDAWEIVNSVIKYYITMANEKGVELINNIPKNSKLFTDEKLLFETISNLISNAIKFCRQGDLITIFLPEGEHSGIAISDTGIGIKPELIADLFQYEKNTSTKGTSGETGTGFGLPLTREIAVALGGDLTVESTPDKGSTFCLKLPNVDEYQ